MANLLPVSPQTFMHAVGIIEIAVGLLVLTRWTRIGAWIAAAWLVLIAGNLATMGLFDIAVRDLAMAVGAYTLARLAELRQGAPVAMREPGLRASRLTMRERGMGTPRGRRFNEREIGTDNPNSAGFGLFRRK